MTVEYYVYNRSGERIRTFSTSEGAHKYKQNHCPGGWVQFSEGAIRKYKESAALRRKIAVGVPGRLR